MAPARAPNRQLAAESSPDRGYAAGEQPGHGALAYDRYLDGWFALEASDAAVSNEPGRRGIGCRLSAISEARSW